MRSVRIAVAILIAAGFLLAQAPSKTAKPAAKTAPKRIPVFDATAMDKSADPCADFYRFACGGWMSKNPIPADQSRWGRFDELQERNLDILREILEKAAKDKNGPITQKIGDMYSSCMDEAKINAEGVKPLQHWLDDIAKLSTRPELVREVAQLQRHGVSVLFRFGPLPDFHNAAMNIAALDQGGLGLPDRDFYFKEDAKSVETRQKYVEHVQNMFALLGDPPEQAAANAKTVMEIETALAKPSMDRVTRRNPANLDHPMTRDELVKLAPGFEFPLYFTAAEPPAFDKLNVTNPEFFKQVSASLDSIPLASWKTYLRWHTVREAAPHLSEPFVRENFNFYRKYLRGQQELQPRWKRCVELTDDLLGEALGQPYVAQTFGPEGKQRTLEMVKAIEDSMGDDLRNLPWMTEETKKAAAVKLAAISNKIGYPDKWRDYSTVLVEPGDHLGNVVRASTFEVRREVKKIGQPVDKLEWGMSPPTVNAYYNPFQNNINFPAGILQPPFYDNAMDDAVNYGGIGAVIGHELTHGFDDSGAKFDAKGDLRNWWSETDKAEFEKRTGCIANEYSGFPAVDDVKVNGKLTLGENTADNGGVRISLMAVKSRLAKSKAKPKPIDGYTPEQRFFIAYGQIWCQNVRPEAARLRAATDPHSPGEWRVKGVVRNMPEFREAFGCKVGQPMAPENACRVW